MAKFTQELGDVETKFFQPQRGVSDDSTAQTITAVGELANDAYTGFRTAQSKDEFTNLSKELDAEPDQESDFTPMERKDLTGFQKEMSKLQQMSDVSGQSDRFRVKAEALLKKQINRSPGLASEFRKSAAGVLGFDPTGEEIKQQMAALDQGETDTKAQLAAFDKDNQSLGGRPGDINTKDGQERYWRMSTIRAQTTELNAMAAYKKAAGLDAKVDLVPQLTASIPDRVAVESGRGKAIINTILEGAGVSENQISAGFLSNDVIANLSDEQKMGAKVVLQKARDQLSAEAEVVRASFTTEAGYKGFLDPQLKVYDDYIGMLDGTVNIAQMKINDDIATARLKDAGKNDKGFQTLDAWAKLFPGVAPPQVTVDAAVGFFNVIVPALEGRGGKPTSEEAAAVTKEEIYKTGLMLEQMIETATGDEGSEAQMEDVTTKLRGYVEMFESGAAFKSSAVEGLVQSLTNPKSIAQFEKIMSTNPDIKATVERTMITHTQRLAATATTQLNARIAEDPRVGAIVPSFIDGQLVLDVNDKVLVDLVQNLPELHKAPTIAESQRVVRKVIRDLESGYISKMNRATSVQSELRGTDRIETMRKAIGDNPAFTKAFVKADFESGKDKKAPKQESKSLNFEQRINNPESFPVIKNKDGTVSTHKMADAEVDGKFIAFPTIVQKGGGKLEELSVKGAIDHAMKTGEFKEFATQEEATAYAKGGYKVGTPLEESGLDFQDAIDKGQRGTKALPKASLDSARAALEQGADPADVKKILQARFGINVDLSEIFG